MTTTIGQQRHDSGRGDGHEGKGKPRHTAIVVNGQEFATEAKELTGLQIKSLAGIPPDYELFAVHGDKSVPVANDEIVHLHERAQFRAIPAGTFGGGVDAAATTC